MYMYAAVIDKSVNKQRIVNNVLMYMCSRRFYVLPEVSGCPNLGSSYEDKKRRLIHLCAMLV